MKIETVGANRFPDLAPLWEQAVPVLAIPYVEEPRSSAAWASWASKKLVGSGGAAFAGVANGKIAGFAELHLLDRGPMWTYRHIAMMRHLFVLPDQRRKGLAAALIQQCIDWARSKGLGTIGVRVRVTDVDFQDWFSGRSFKPYYIRTVRSLDSGPAAPSPGVRRSGAADVAAVVEMFGKLHQHDATLGLDDPLESGWEKELEKRLRREPAWVYADGSRRPGMLLGETYKPQPFWKLDRAAITEKVFVQPDARRKGVGRGLLEAFLSHCVQRGVTAVTTGYCHADDAAGRFWRAFGFADSVLFMYRNLRTT